MAVPGALLLRLAASHPAPVRRDDLVHDLYGESGTADARNRFRVALTRLRRAVPLLETDDGVALDPDVVEVDVTDLGQRLADIALEPSAEAESALLKELLGPLATVLFPGAASDWELDAQGRWSLAASRALERLGRLAEEAIDNATAASAAEAALRHFPYDAEAWEQYLRAMTRLGRGAEAGRNLAAAQRRARAEGWPFPESLEAWIPHREERDALGPELSPGESLALERFFRRTLVQQPDLAVEILGSNSFRPEVLRSPRAVLPLLREALALSVGPSEARERIQVRVITALSLLELETEVLAEAERFLAQPVAPARRRIALLNASFAHATLGDLDRAIERVEEAMALVSVPDADYARLECVAQRATFLMFRGEFAVAEAALRDSIANLERLSQEGAERDLLSIRGNLALCLVLQDRSEEAVAVLRPVVEVARRMGLQDVLGVNAPVLALALANTGAPMGPAPTEGLRAAYRMGPRRAIIAVAIVGLALYTAGADPGCSTLLEAWAHRRLSPIALNATEIRIYRPVLDQRPEATRPLVDFVRATLRLSSRAGGG